MKNIIEKNAGAAEMAAESAAALLRDKPEAVLGFDFAFALEPFCRRLEALCASGMCSLKKAKVFCTDEFVGSPGHDAGSVRSFVWDNLVKRCGADGQNVYSPCAVSGAGADRNEAYDAAIAEAGGMDLLVLGIGMNGRIGFNEPATPFDSFTHIQKLTDVTKAEFVPFFGSADEVPEEGVTMGIKTIMAARKIILIASGEEKADIIHKIVCGKTVTYVPASMLQLHLDTTLYLDEAAASKLG